MTHLRLPRAVRAALPAVLLALILAPAARGQTFEGDYTLSYLGLTVARASFATVLDAETYSVEGTVSSAGLGRIFDNTKGTISASGSFATQPVTPQRFRTDYVSAKKPQTTEIQFARGDVSRTINEPPLRVHTQDWVPLRDEDLKAVLDPLSATLVRADSLDAVCGRTVRMYEGQMRADLTLTRVESGTIAIPGYAGATVTCRLGFKPVSGYRPSRNTLKYLQDKSRILVAFAPLGASGLYAPVHATVGTPIGTLTIRARRYEQTR